MLQFVDNHVIFVGIIIIGFLAFGFNILLITYVYRLLKRMVAYHDSFVFIHEELDAKIERVIQRQSKVATILWAILNESRVHQKRVSKVFKELGVNPESDDS